MTERYKVVARVASQKGTCASGHKVDDEWVIGDQTLKGICLSAFGSLYPVAQVLMFGGTLPWEANPDVAFVACPDPNNPVVFQLRLLRK